MKKTIILLMLVVSVVASAETLTPEIVFENIHELVLKKAVGDFGNGRFSMALAIRDTDDDGIEELIALPKELLNRVLKEKKKSSVFIPIAEVETYEETKKHEGGGEYIIQGVREVKTKETLHVITIPAIIWHGKNDVIVNYSFYRGSLDAYGGSYLLRWQKGKWKIIKKVSGWES